jgi:hypothetical protein
MSVLWVEVALAAPRRWEDRAGAGETENGISVERRLESESDAGQVLMAAILLILAAVLMPLLSRKALRRAVMPAEVGYRQQIGADACFRFPFSMLTGGKKRQPEGASPCDGWQGRDNDGGHLRASSFSPRTTIKERPCRG